MLKVAGKTRWVCHQLAATPSEPKAEQEMIVSQGMSTSKFAGGPRSKSSRSLVHRSVLTIRSAK